VLTCDAPLLDALTHLEALIERLEEGEPISHQVRFSLERMIWMTDQPLAEDLSEVRTLLEDLSREPSSHRVARLRQAVESLGPVGPTASASANALLDSAVTALQGEPRGEFAARLEAFESELATLASLFSNLGAGGPSEAFREVARKGGQQLELVRFALGKVEEAVTSSSQEDFQQAGPALVMAVNCVAQSFRELERLRAVEGRVACVQCGHSNMPDRIGCQECGAPLPATKVDQEVILDVQIGGDGTSGQTQMTENLARILRACEQYCRGTLEVDAFLREVGWLKDLFFRAQRLGLGEGEEVQQAIQEFQAALDLLQNGGEHEERGLVDTGRRRLWEAAGKLQASA